MNSNKFNRVGLLLENNVPHKIKSDYLVKCQKEVARSSLDMQHFVKEHIFTQSKRPPYESVDELGTGQFWCSDCGDKYSLKSSYDLHLNRCTIKISHYCKICKKKYVFTNKCMMLAHLRKHTSSSLSFNLLGITAEPLPAELLPLDVVDLEYDFTAVTNMSMEELEAASLKLTHIKNKNANTESRINYRCPGTQLDESNKSSVSISETDTPASVAFSVYQQNCIICLEKFTSTTTLPMKHFKMLHYQRQEEFSRCFSCRYCKLQLPNKCAQIAHNNVHTSKPPYICPECGLVVSNLEAFGSHLSFVCYHFSRSLDVECKISNCFSTHSFNVLPIHFISNHTKQSFMCHKCSLNFNTLHDLSSHLLQLHQQTVNRKTDTFHQCLLCKNKKFQLFEIKSHTFEHENLMSFKCVFRCDGCRRSINDFIALKQHISKCAKYQNPNLTKSHSFHPDLLLSSNHSENVVSPFQNTSLSNHKYLRKFCNACKKSFVYLYNQCDKNKLPTKCPLCGNISDFKTVAKIFPPSNDLKARLLLNDQREGKKLDNNINDMNSLPIEHEYANDSIADEKMSVSEDDDTIFINNFVPETKSISNKIYNVSTTKRTKRKVTRHRKKQTECRVADGHSSPSSNIGISKVSNPEDYVCAVCYFESSDKKIFHDHIITHRNVSTAYQCMECGLSFSVRPSFATHLLTTHGISNIEEYLQKNNCVDVQAIAKLGSDMSAHPANENQCSICYEQFENKIEHDKHFRIHGMAFLANTKQMTTQKSTM